MLKESDLTKIEHYLNGTADKKEKEWVESQFSKGEDNLSFRNYLESDWENTNPDKSQYEINLNHQLDRIHHLIRKKESMENQKPLRKVISIYTKAAAILLLPLLLTGAIAYTLMSGKNKSGSESVSTSIFAPLGSRVSFKLPDGTTGMLNSGSHLSYSIPFNNDRRVDLDGEAWFDVFHDEKKPFEVTAGSAKIKVLGTSFNLSAYPVDNFVEVVLQEGKVEFTNDANGEKFIVMPSERLISNNGVVSKTITDPEKYNAWTQGKLVFRGDPMKEVARRIARWYNVEVELADQKLERYSFRAIFVDDSLEEVLRYLSMTSPISYKIAPRELMKDGTYKKEVVTFYLK
jgi:transmembrane sensor